ncbi:hypothetical protein [Bdellovibrio sp. NC01]|uniref:hypothetical protein n=1 Tax=Bdellovibrio sp. NC01 TaxID=2220073 RepID=UPI0011586E01|nr:hypothetical protein [Bdellovibrio sp. NC01]
MVGVTKPFKRTNNFIRKENQEKTTKYTGKSWEGIAIFFHSTFGPLKINDLYKKTITSKTKLKIKIFPIFSRTSKVIEVKLKNVSLGRFLKIKYHSKNLMPSNDTGIDALKVLIKLSDRNNNSISSAPTLKTSVSVPRVKYKY